MSLVDTRWVYKRCSVLYEFSIIIEMASYMSAVLTEAEVSLAAYENRWEFAVLIKQLLEQEGYERACIRQESYSHEGSAFGYCNKCIPFVVSHDCLEIEDITTKVDFMHNVALCDLEIELVLPSRFCDGCKKILFKVYEQESCWFDCEKFIN